MTANWSDALPPAPGAYWWRHSPKWEPIVRVVFHDSEGRLCVDSHRFSAETPISWVGGEWGPRFFY